MPALRLHLWASDNYLLLDRFAQAQAASAGSYTRTCDPGPGSLAIVDTNGVMSAASGKWTINGTVAASDRAASGSTYARTAGRAYLWSIPTRTTINSSCRFGWGTSASDSQLDIGLDYSSTSDVRLKTGNTVIDTVAIGAGAHDYAAVMRGTGGFLFGRSGGSGTYTLLWVYNTGTAAEFLKAFVASGGTTINFLMDDVRVIDLPSPYTTDYGLATDRKATSAANDTITMTANAIVEHTLTAATGVTQDIMVRRTDDNNCVIIRCDQTNSTIKLYEKNAGVETEKTGGTTSQTWTNGTQYRVVITLDGSTVKTYVANAAKNSNASVTFNQTATGAKVDCAGVDFVSWPRAVAVPAV